MWAIIPVAGRGSRLHPLTETVPKALIEIGGRTIVERLLEQVTPAVSQVCLVVHTADRLIRDTIGTSFRDTPVHYVTQPAPSGVGDAIVQARSLVHGPFVVVMGDVYYDRSLVPYVDAWHRAQADGAVLVEYRKTPSEDPVGIVDVEDGTVVGIRKAPYVPGQGARICGMLILPPPAFHAYDEIVPASTGEYEVEDLVARLLARAYTFLAIPYSGWRRNINTPADIAAVERRLAQVN